MQISSNTTGMMAGLTVSTDKNGQDYCVVVVKGTFDVNDYGKLSLAKEQNEMVYVDAHYGDPAETSIEYECDFSPFKPFADVMVNGFAYSPTGQPVKELAVQLEVGPIRKQLMVIGDRQWDVSQIHTNTTPIKSFVKMPLVYEKAFGGVDTAHENHKHHGAELRNLVGTGYHKSTNISFVNGTSLPNVEYPGHLISKCSDKPPPAGFGALGRGWKPKIDFAGTYDQNWIDNVFPFLPQDFDEMYFQSAPADQQMPYLQGGEFVRCVNMSPGQVFSFSVPKISLPIVYRFRDRDVDVSPNLDTLVIEPDKRRVLLAWRTRVKLGRKLNALREIRIGGEPPFRFTKSGKLYFSSISEFIAWKKK